MRSHSFVQGGALSLLFFAAAYAQDCVLTVPRNPLTAQGLATPYTVTGCNQRDFAAQASFVEAAIFDPAANTISIYHPLVVNKGDVAGKNFIAPVTPTVPAGSTVGIWFGSNAMTLTLDGPGAAQCVNGFQGSIFGQFAHCNGDVFMKVSLFLRPCTVWALTHLIFNLRLLRLPSTMVHLSHQLLVLQRTATTSANALLLVTSVWLIWTNPTMSTPFTC